MVSDAGTRSASRHTAAANQVSPAAALCQLLAVVQLCSGQTYRQLYTRQPSPAAYSAPPPLFRSAAGLASFPRGQYLSPGAQLLPVRGLHKRLALSPQTPFGKPGNAAAGPQLVPLYGALPGKALDAQAMSSESGAAPQLVQVAPTGMVGYDAASVQEAYTPSINQAALPGAAELHYGGGTPVFGNLGYPPGFGISDDEKSVGRVKMQVYRGPTVKAGHGHFAPWGYYVWQPSGTETAQSAFQHV